MSDRSQLIDKLQNNRNARAAYIRAKVGVLVSSQLHGLRLRNGWTQAQFAHHADMKQSRVSAMEQPGAVNFNLETLVRAAATYGVGLQVKFVPFSEMLEWENNFRQDIFNPTPVDRDVRFLTPGVNITQFAGTYALRADVPTSSWRQNLLPSGDSESVYESRVLPYPVWGSVATSVGGEVIYG